MIPDWLYNHSIINETYFTVQPTYLEILAGNNDFERLIQAELISPNILTATDSVVVILTIAMDTVLADSSDHDPIFGISDGSSFVGFQVVNPSNYADHTPCYNLEGDSIDNILQNGVYDHTTGTKVNSRHFSSEITMQIKPNDQWGSCHTEHDEGNVRISNYQHKLDLTKGLYFEMYRHDAAEEYHIKYIAVQVHLDSLSN